MPPRTPTDHRPLDPLRLLPGDELSAQRPQEGVRNRGESKWPQTLQDDRGTAQQRIVREAPEKLRVVVVEREQEADGLNPLRALGPDPDGSVRMLPGARVLSARKRKRQPAAAEDARCVAREPR